MAEPKIGDEVFYVANAERGEELYPPSVGRGRIKEIHGQHYCIGDYSYSRFYIYKDKPAAQKELLAVLDRKIEIITKALNNFTEYRENLTRF